VTSSYLLHLLANEVQERGIIRVPSVQFSSVSSGQGTYFIAP